MAGNQEYETLRKHGLQGMRPVVDMTESLERQYEKSLKPKTPEALLTDDAFQRTVATASEEIPVLMLAAHRYMNGDFYGTVSGLQHTLKKVNENLKERLDSIVYVPVTGDWWKGKYNLHGDYDKLMKDMEDLTFLADELVKSKKRTEIQLGEISDLSLRLALLKDFGLSEEEARKEIEAADERQRQREKQQAEEERRRKAKEEEEEKRRKEKAEKEEEERQKRAAAAEEERKKKEKEDEKKREEEEKRLQKQREKEEVDRIKREEEEEKKKTKASGIGRKKEKRERRKGQTATGRRKEESRKKRKRSRNKTTKRRRG